MKASPEACPACASPSRHGQEYCLDCGTCLVPRRKLGALGRAWERRLGRYPGDWLVASLLLLLIAVGSSTAGIATSGHARTRGGGETIVAISPVVAAPPTAPADTSRPNASTTPTPARQRPERKTPIDWPPRDGFTVILAAIPARGAGLTDAAAAAKAAIAAGLRNVGVLESARFASLHPGYYVVFAGIYGSLEDAQTATSRVVSRFPNAYARQIAR